MKFLITILLVLFIVIQVTAQVQFENPGFEEWEDISYGNIPEPVNWSSARTSLPDELAQVAPAIWDRSEDAHSGNYSVYLISKSAFGIVATGTVTNGRVFADLDPNKGYVFTDPEDERWNSPIAHKPDSVIGWYKANPKTGDFPTIKVVLHKGYASTPQEDSSGWIAVARTNLSADVVNSWTRFSAPFQYFKDETPEYMLAVLTAGNGVNSIAGGEAWFDDLQLVYNNISVTEYSESQLYANYSNGYLHLLFDKDSGKVVQLVLKDINGRRMFEDRLRSGEKHAIALDIEPGVYIITASMKNIKISRKLVVR